MQFLGILLLFGGYTLVYAATAHGGQFATEPWAGLFADAYTGQAADQTDQAATGQPTLGQIGQRFRNAPFGSGPRAIING